MKESAIIYFVEDGDTYIVTLAKAGEHAPMGGTVKFASPAPDCRAVKIQMGTYLDVILDKLLRQDGDMGGVCAAYSYTHESISLYVGAMGSINVAEYKAVFPIQTREDIKDALGNALQAFRDDIHKLVNCHTAKELLGVDSLDALEGVAKVIIGGFFRGGDSPPFPFHPSSGNPFEWE